MGEDSILPYLCDVFVKSSLTNTLSLVKSYYLFIYCKLVVVIEDLNVINKKRNNVINVIVVIVIFFIVYL